MIDLSLSLLYGGVGILAVERCSFFSAAQLLLLSSPSSPLQHIKAGLPSLLRLLCGINHFFFSPCTSVSLFGALRWMSPPPFLSDKPYGMSFAIRPALRLLRRLPLRRSSTNPPPLIRLPPGIFLSFPFFNYPNPL